MASKRKKVTRAQLAAAERGGAKVKKDPIIVKLTDIEQLLDGLKTMHEDNVRTASLIGKALVMLLNKDKDADGRTVELAEAIKALASNIDNRAMRPVYHFEASRTDDGFDITATPQPVTKH